MEINKIPGRITQELQDNVSSTEADYPKNRVIHSLFEEQVEKTPDKEAVVFGNQKYTYKELNEKSDQMAGMLRKKGVTSHTVIMIIVEHSADMVVAMLGVLKAGAAYLLIDPAELKNQLISVLKDYRIHMVITNTGTVTTDSFSALQHNYELSHPELHVTDTRPQILDLDSLPLTNRSLVNYDKYNQYIGVAPVKSSISLLGTRGCPYHCAYCHKIWPKNHVFRSAENIFEEVKFYHNMGVRRFTILDDIFNFNRKNSTRFFRLIINSGMGVQFFFTSGLRADILTDDYIDLLVEAGATVITLALETASPRLQKLINKNLKIEKLRERIEYFCKKYPNVILELQTMHGFPSETEEEAMKTLNFIKESKWLHFPYIHILKIYENTDMEKIALDNGVSREAIIKSLNMAWHELPYTLPFDRSFTLKYQSDFMYNYFLLKERLLHVLPHQMKVLTENELIQKYNSYLPVDIKNFSGLLQLAGISNNELAGIDFLDENLVAVPELHKKMKKLFPVHKPSKNSLNVLLLDLSQFFSDNPAMLYDVVEPPFGLMCLLTYLVRQHGDKIEGKIAKSRIDFDSFAELKELIGDFKPDVIGVRTLSFYRKFFHKTIRMIRGWGIDIPIIAGGPYATSDYPILFRDKNIDLAVIGEGEITFSEVIEQIIKNNGKLPEKEILKGIKGIVLPMEKEDNRRETTQEIILLDKIDSSLSAEPCKNPEHTGHPDDVACIVLKPDVKEKPAAVMIEHTSLINVCYWHTAAFTVTPSDRAAKYVGFDSAVSAWEIFPYLLTGSTVYIVNKNMETDIRRLHTFFEDNKITISFLPIQICEQFMLMDNTSLRVLLTGGGALKQYIKRKYKLVNLFGVPEGTGVSTGFIVQEHNNPLCVGKPISNTRIYILDKNKKCLPVGETGELFISGDGVARGYLHDPELTEQRFVPDPFRPGKKMFRTGEIGCRLADGNIQLSESGGHVLSGGKKDVPVDEQDFRDDWILE